ncbi:MAG: hypothetical protein ACPL06_00795 [Candidatus Anstonellales archaeon]
MNPLIFAAIGIMVSAIALAFMFASFAKKPEWEAWAKVELYELAWGIILLIVIYGVYNAVSFIADAYLGTNIINYSENRLNDVVKDRLLPAFIQLAYLDHNIIFWSQFKHRFGPTVWGITSKLYPGLEIYSQPVRILEFGYMAAFASLSVQIMLFHLLDVITEFLIAAGILLRFFPPTRSSGNLLIALGFSFKVILPLVYVLSFQALDEIYKIHGWSMSGVLRTAYIPQLIGTTMPMVLTLAPGLFHSLLNNFGHLSVEILVIPSTAMTIAISATTSLQKALEWKTIELGGLR